MYLKKIVCENMGSILNLNINLGFDDNKLPKPLIFVGRNGAGKSTLISNIVDSLYEFSSDVFNDTVIKAGMGHKYYKIINYNQIHEGKNYMDVYLEYEGDDTKVKYCMKSGKRKFIDFCNENNIDIDANIQWNDDKNYKKTFLDQEYIQREFYNNTYCYFPPDRYEKPYWMNEQYANKLLKEQIKIEERFSNILGKPITINNIVEDNLKWLLDIIVDSRADLKINENLEFSFKGDVNELLLLSVAKLNIEKIMSDILGEEVYFTLNNRNYHGSRFIIKSSSTDKIIVPTLDSLSTGQLALFNIFSTIIRYSDLNDVNKSIHLSDIKGIVIIDEIELHLHSDLQREILPKLIKRFPKIQFIITSHSPLFLLGMKDEFSDEGFDLYQMPNGEKIDVERFSEFQNAYKYLCDTELHRKNIKNTIEKFSTKETLIITEGSTDWKHMCSALRKLNKSEEYKNKYDGLEDKFLKFEPLNSTKEYEIKIEMGKDSLVEMCRSFSKVKRNNKIIFIADRDDKNTNKALMCDNTTFKKWGNNVYSFIIPIPEHRVSTPDICIEHYYTDEEIKTIKKCGDTIERRLYIGNEFDEDGINHIEKKYCKNKNSCGKNKINIIEGSSKDRVISLDDTKENKTNYALSKTEFAEAILNEEEEFKDINFANFHLIFDIIKDILDNN